MTRKDYVLLAECFDSVRQMGELNLHPSKVDSLTWHMLRAAVASALASDNERFNIDRFYAACGHFPTEGG